jgi:hypothetical protein
MRSDAGTAVMQEMTLFLAIDLPADGADQIVDLIVGLQERTERNAEVAK